MLLKPTYSYNLKIPHREEKISQRFFSHSFPAFVCIQINMPRPTIKQAENNTIIGPIL